MCDTGWLTRLELGELANRVNSEAKAAKKRAKGHHERQAEAEARVKLAKRKAPALEKGEEKAAQPEAEAAALGAQQQLLEEHEAAAEAPDGDDDAPLFQRSFFPAPVEEPVLKFADDDPLMHSCMSLLSDMGGGCAAAALHPAILSRELLINGSVRQFYKRAKSCPSDMLRQLFQSLALASDERMASACFGVMAALLGASEPDEAALGICTGIHYASVLHVDPPSQCVPGWLPGPADFLDTLTAQGYTAGPSEDASTPEAQAQVEPILAPRMHSLALLLRLLPTAFRAEDAQKGWEAPRREALPALLLALLRLCLDPAACALARDLELAAHATIEAFSESNWRQSLLRLAADAAEVGASHRGHLEAVKVIPAHSARGGALRHHALLALLCTVIPGHGAPINRGRSGPEGPPNVPEALGRVPWFAGGKAAASLADGAVAEGSGYRPAELHTALQAAHMLAWEHERAHGREGFVEQRWLPFLRALEAAFAKRKSGELAGIKLLLTTLLSFPAAMRV